MMDVNQYVARFMVHKVGAFVVKERVLCFGARGFSTYDPDSQMLTNTWSYEEVEGSSTLEGETDFVILTPRHRIKKTVYRCHYRMEVLVCLMRLRSQHQALTGRPRAPELETHAFPCLKYHKRGLQSSCVVEICPDGVNQRDDEGELMSHIPYTSLVSIDLLCDNHEAILLNHADNSSLFLVERRTDMALAIHRVMRAYGMEINEYRKKTMELATRDDPGATTQGDGISFQYPVMKLSSAAASTTTTTTAAPPTPRILSVSEKYIALYADHDTMISSRPLTRVYSLILFDDPAQGFEIVYVDGVRRRYASEHREKIVCELLASCHALKNFQVEVTTYRVPESIRMVPRKIIQSEGAKLVTRGKDPNVMDRELRVVQSVILQQMASHGSSKTARIQRQLPMGIDDRMHTLAVEFNANSPTWGVIAQPSKPFDKVVFFVAREIRDVCGRHGPRHEYLATYLQTLYRLLQAPPAAKEFVVVLDERGDEYLSTIADILVGRSSVTVYWMLMVLHRLMESKAHKIQSRAIFLSNNIFVTSLLSLFDIDQKSQQYLSDLPAMKLCQLIFCLVKTNPERQHDLSKSLYEQLAKKSRMIHRILFGFPDLATVEACVGILSRMTNNPASVHYDGIDAELLRTPIGQPPPLSMGFGEHMNYDVQHHQRNGSWSSRRGVASRLHSSRSTRLTQPPSSESKSAGITTPGTGVVVQNPEVLLRQYRLFLESPCGSAKKSIDQYSDPVYLHLRYRCRSVFLQEIMSHLVGNFDDFKRVFSVECHHFSGFVGKSNGQREKSDLYITPRALIAVRVMNRYTQEFPFRSIQQINTAPDHKDAFAITVGDKLRYVYSDAAPQLINRMRECAGVIGMQIRCTKTSQLPKNTKRDKQSRIANASALSIDPVKIEVSKRSGRSGFYRFRKRSLFVMDSKLHEVDFGGEREKVYLLKDLRRVVTPAPSNELGGEFLVVLDYVDGLRVAYQLMNVDSLLGQLHDGCLCAKNRLVTLGTEYSRVNPRMSGRHLLRTDMERFAYCNEEGLYLMSHGELSKELDKMKADAVSLTSTSEKVVFALENMIVSVEDADFGNRIMESRLKALDFRPILRGLTSMLRQASKPPLRVNEIAVILGACCRINDGCYGLSKTIELLPDIVEVLLNLLVSDVEIATYWAIRTIHSLIVDRSGAQKQTERRVRELIFSSDEAASRFANILIRRDALCAAAVLDMLRDVMIKTRASTDNNQFDGFVKQLSGVHEKLLLLAMDKSNIGLAVMATSVLKATLEHCDAKTRANLCDAALLSGLTIRCIYHALFDPTEDGREVYRSIAGMWILHHRHSWNLLCRILPSGFLRILSTPIARAMILREQEQQASEKKAKKEKKGKRKPSRFVVRMKQELSSFNASPSRIAKVKVDETRVNYNGESIGDVGLLGTLIQHDFCLPDLVWNSSMRKVLKQELERCLDIITENSMGVRSLAASTHSVFSAQDRLPVVWNHAQFQVRFNNDDLQVSNVYLRVLLKRIRDGSLQLQQVEKAWNSMSNETKGTSHGEVGQLICATIGIAKSPVDFFSELYQRWLETRVLLAPASAGVDSTQFSISELINVNAEDDVDVLMKGLIEVAKAFPSVSQFLFIEPVS